MSSTIKDTVIGLLIIGILLSAVGVAFLVDSFVAKTYTVGYVTRTYSTTQFAGLGAALTIVGLSCGATSLTLFLSNRKTT